MKLLHTNDSPGTHAPSWYQATCKAHEREQLSQAVTYQTCVIGAGFTGLSTALHLAKSGTSVVLLDAHRIGWGATGRNGGQLGSGFNMGQPELERLLGKKNAASLWKLAEDAKQLIHSLCAEYAIDMDYVPGIVTALHKKKYVSELHDYCKYLADHYTYDQLEPLGQNELQQRVNSDNYFGGAVDHGAGHIHPLKLATGMATAAEQCGAKIFEMSEVLKIAARPKSTEYEVSTASGSVLCENVVLATNGYIDDLQPAVNRKIMPINNFIAVTEPLGALATELLPQDDAVADSRFVVNYFRRVDNDRILFGGGENYSYRFPPDIQQIVRRAMLGVFPQLSKSTIDYAWGGTLAITRNRLPYAHQLEPGLYTAGGYSGHGVALASLYGQAIAQHITGDPDRFDLLASLPNKTFPGGKRARSALLAVAMTGYSWLDRL